MEFDNRLTESPSYKTTGLAFVVGCQFWSMNGKTTVMAIYPALARILDRSRNSVPRSTEGL